MKATVDAVGKFIKHIPDSVLWECQRRIVANRLRDDAFPDLVNVRDFERAYSEIKLEEMDARKRADYEGRQALIARMKQSAPPVRARHMSELARETERIGQRPVGPKKRQEAQGDCEDEPDTEPTP